MYHKFIAAELKRSLSTIPVFMDDAPTGQLAPYVIVKIPTADIQSIADFKEAMPTLLVLLHCYKCDYFVVRDAMREIRQKRILDEAEENNLWIGSSRQVDAASLLDTNYLGGQGMDGSVQVWQVQCGESPNSVG